ncbi:MAG: dCTP deaminase, partial [Candidatus Bipolaricaulia bacterium]
MVELLAGSDTKAFVNGLIHEGTQVQEGSILLSVATVSILQTRAEFDFGGSEYRTAQQEKIAPEKRSPDDRYGWWSLEPG